MYIKNIISYNGFNYTENSPALVGGAKTVFDDDSYFFYTFLLIV